MDDRVLRERVLELLGMGGAHVTLDEAVKGLDPVVAFRRPAGDGHELHAPWELLEHMRIRQEDILRYTMDASWRSPPWPEGYWPNANELELPTPAHAEQKWRETLDGFRADLEGVRAWVRDEGLDLTSRIPHGEGRTYLRQVLLVADHNAYHLGQLVWARKSLGAWE